MKFEKSVVIFSIVFIMIGSIEGRPQARCPAPNCPFGGCPIPTNCVHGLHIDSCGKTICAKGPGERCKIQRFQFQGNCGLGLYCQCGICMGCSLQTFECFESTCIIPMRSYSG